MLARMSNPSPYSPSPKFRDRQHVLLIEIAESVLASEGLAAVQARRIAKEAGCSVGTLYNIFGDIDGLILAANERTLNALGVALQRAAANANSGDLKSRLMALATAYLDFATANPRRWRAVFEHRLPEGREIPAFYVEDRRRLIGLIETQIAPVIAHSQPRSDAAHALFSAVHGIVLLSLDEKLSPFDPATCHRQLRFLIENVSCGLE